jgi:flavin reductase (DIM6/NTAB) family NADH-FMN oxidoreductase RutF
VAPDVDEFALAGMVPAPSRLINTPRVAASPVSFECRLIRVLQLTDAAGTAVAAWLTLGEVVGVHIDPSLVVNGVYDTVAAHPVVRGGGPSEYFEVTAETRFHMTRPR